MYNQVYGTCNFRLAWPILCFPYEGNSGLHCFVGFGLLSWWRPALTTAAWFALKTSPDVCCKASPLYMLNEFRSQRLDLAICFSDFDHMLQHLCSTFWVTFNVRGVTTGSEDLTELDGLDSQLCFVAVYLMLRTYAVLVITSVVMWLTISWDVMIIIVDWAMTCTIVWLTPCCQTRQADWSSWFWTCTVPCSHDVCTAGAFWIPITEIHPLSVIGKYLQQEFWGLYRGCGFPLHLTGVTDAWASAWLKGHVFSKVACHWQWLLKTFNTPVKGEVESIYAPFRVQS